MSTENMNIRVTLQNAAKAGLKNMKGDLSTIDKRAAGAASSMKGLYTQLAAFATLLAGGALFGSSIKTFASFDDNMRAAGAVTRATAEELADMTQVAKDMGRETRYTASQAAEALKFLGMAGFTAAQSTSALPDVLNLAAAGALDLGTAADIATNVLTSFGLEVENLGQVNDVLVGTFTSSNVNLIEFGEAFKMVGAVGKGVGADFEDLAATIGKLGNAGIKGTMGGVAMKNAIEALLNPTAAEAKLMGELTDRLGGVALKVTDAQGDFIGFKEITEQLTAANVTGIEALRLFGLRAGPGMAALMQQGQKGTEDLRDALKDMGGIAALIADQMESGLGGELRRTKSVMESFQITTGEAFGPEVIIVLEAFQGWIKSISAEIVKLQENGGLAGIGETIIDIFSTVNWVLGKATDLLQSWVALTIAGAAAITGHFGIAKEALKGYLKEANEFAGTTIIDPNDIVYPITDAMNKARKIMEDAANPAGPIGKGGKKVNDAIFPEVNAETKLKAALIQLNALLDKESAQLEVSHDSQLISLNAYHDKRIAMIEQKMALERNILQGQADNETDINKREILNAKLYAMDQALLAAKIQINAERKSDQDQVDEDILASKVKLNKNKLLADKAYKDQLARLDVEGVTTLDAEMQGQLAALQERQNKELAVIKTYHETVLQSLRDRKATEAEIEQASANQKLAIDKQVAAQAIEADQLATSQALALSEYRMNNMKQIASGTSEVFGQLYTLLGEKNKELFYISKAAAIAEATMNIAQGITKAIAQGGIWGIAQGVMIGIAGAAQIATIASQGLAGGGEVLGSGGPKADDQIIAASTGEFVEQSAAVRYYGKDKMQGLNDLIFPKDIFDGYKTGGYVRKNYSNRFADGGLLTKSNQSSNDGTTGSSKINIINVTDPSQIDQYLSSADGQNAVLNVLGARPEEAQRLLRNGA